MRVNAEFDRFVLFAGVWSSLGCHRFEVRGTPRVSTTSCHLAKKHGIRFQPRNGGTFAPGYFRVAKAVAAGFPASILMKCSRTLPALVFLLAALPCALAADPAKPDAGERRKIAGTWKGFAVEGKGENPDRGPVKLELIITEKTIHGIEKKGEGQIDHGEGEYTFDLVAKPAVLDAGKTAPNGRKDTWIGIYQLDGDILRWCVAKRERPTTFETVKGQFLLILKRDKAAR